MTRWVFLCLAGTLILTEPARAGDHEAGAGRYQVIPDGMVPGKNGKPQERTILLDSSSGRTWILVPGSGKGSSSRPHWVPMELRIRDRVEVSTDSAKPATALKPKEVNTPPSQRYDYDDNP